MRGWGIAVFVLVTLSCGGAAPQRKESEHPPALPGALSPTDRAARWAEDDAAQERHLAELAAERARLEQERQERARLAAEQFAANQRARELEVQRAAAEAERVEAARREQEERERTRTVIEPSDPDDSEPSGGSYCCKVCHKGCACGNTCISCNYTCHVGRGCACDG